MRSINYQWGSWVLQPVTAEDTRHPLFHQEMKMSYCCISLRPPPPVVGVWQLIKCRNDFQSCLITVQLRTQTHTKMMKQNRAMSQADRRSVVTRETETEAIGRKGSDKSRKQQMLQNSFQFSASLCEVAPYLLTLLCTLLLSANLDQISIRINKNTTVAQI